MFWFRPLGGMPPPPPPMFFGFPRRRPGCGCFTFLVCIPLILFLLAMLRGM